MHNVTWLGECCTAIFLHHFQANKLSQSARFQHTLQHLAHTPTCKTDAMLLLMKVQWTVAKGTQICCSSSWSVLGFDQFIFPLAHPYRKTTCSKIRTSHRPGHWSLMPNPLTRKLPVTECTNRKYEMRRHSTLHELRFYICVPMKNNVQHGTIT